MCEPDPDQHSEGCRDEGEDQDPAEWDRDSTHWSQQERQVSTQSCVVCCVYQSLFSDSILVFIG